MSKAFTDIGRAVATVNRASERKFRWGVAGYGDVVKRRVGPGILAGDGAVIAGLWGRDPARARQTASHFGTVCAEMLEELCREVDALYVATPISSHVPIATAAIRLGCPVLLEKPLSAGLGDIGYLTHLACSTLLPVGVAYYRRLMPAIRQLDTMIRTQTFGRARAARVWFSSPFDPALDDPRIWRHDRAVAGGGVLADAGSHRLDLLVMLFGLPNSIVAEFDDCTAGGCERRARVSLAWHQALVAELDVAWCALTADRLELDFERTRLVLDPLDGGTIQIWQDGTQIGAINSPVPANPHEAIIRDFERAVRTGRSPACPIDSGVLTDRLLMAAASSHASGHTVRMDAF